MINKMIIHIHGEKLWNDISSCSTCKKSSISKETDRRSLEGVWRKDDNGRVFVLLVPVSF